jgi:putative spermidine/putrescine transport system ATP-binding protein
MNQGHMEQVGTPVDIYDNPRTPFVATFVGTVNVLRASIVDSAKGMASVGGQLIHLDTETVGQIQQRGAAETKLAIRPEKIALEARPDSNHLILRIESVSFMGALVQIYASLSDHQALILTHLNDERTRQLESNQALDVYFSPAAVKVMN